MEGSLINIFQKALKRTHDTWFGKAMGLFDRKTIDDEVWDELEELLISADVGVTTTTKLIDTVKQKASEENMDGSRVSALLQEQMVNILCVPPREDSDNTPSPKVILLEGSMAAVKQPP